MVGGTYLFLLIFPKLLWSITGAVTILNQRNKIIKNKNKYKYKICKGGRRTRIKIQL